MPSANSEPVLGEILTDLDPQAFATNFPESFEISKWANIRPDSVPPENYPHRLNLMENFKAVQHLSERIKFLAEGRPQFEKVNGSLMWLGIGCDAVALSLIGPGTDPAPEAFYNLADHTLQDRAESALDIAIDLDKSDNWRQALSTWYPAIGRLFTAAFESVEDVPTAVYWANKFHIGSEAAIIAVGMCADAS